MHAFIYNGNNYDQLSLIGSICLQDDIQTEGLPNDCVPCELEHNTDEFSVNKFLEQDLLPKVLLCSEFLDYIS